MNYIFLDTGIEDLIAVRGKTIEALTCEGIPIDQADTIQMADGVRAVLISAMPAGALKRHVQLLTRFPQVRHWIIALVNVTIPAVRRSVMSRCDAALKEMPAYHEYVFDGPGLENLRATLTRPVKSDYQLAVLSGNSALAERVAAVMRHWLEGWEVVTSPDEQEAETADAVLIAGSTAEDFLAVKRPSHAGDPFIWVEQPWPDPRDDLFGALHRAQWELRADWWVHGSSLVNEEAAVRLRSGECSAVTLRNEPDFVMWDRYGLPMLPDAYVEPVVDEFLTKNTCLSVLGGMLNDRIAKKGAAT